MPRITLRTAFPFLVAGLSTLAGVLPAKEAAAASPYLVVPEPSVAEATAAYRYANMTATEALAELDKRKVPYKLADPIAGVVAAVRLTGKLHGVHIHSSIPESQRATSVYEVLDARLALALDDFAKILSRHDIEEVVHYSLYRPNVPRADHDLKDDAADRKVAKESAAEAKAAAANGNASGAVTKAAADTKAGAPVGKSVAPVGKSAAPVGKSVATVGKTVAPVGKSVAPVGKSVAPVRKSVAPVGKTVASGAHLPSALPSVPAGKAFPSPPSKAEHTHGAKQKTPTVAEKKVPAAAEKKVPAAAEKKAAAPAPVAPAAPSTKPGAASAAGRAASATTGRPASPRAAAPKKTGSAPHVRPRMKTVARVESKAPATVAVAKVESKAPAAKAPAATAKVESKAAAVASVGHAHKHSHGTRQTWAAPGTRHPAGLAIDVAMLKKRDGQWVSVATHFRGRIGDKTCGDGVRTADSPEARELRSIVCEANDLGVFTYVLTPNYNAAHFDHFHMEIRPQVKWFLYQ